MATIKFATGQTVNFNGNPTPADIEEVAQKLGIKPGAAPQEPAQVTKPGSVIDSILNFGTKVTDFVGGGGVADAFGTEIARIGKSSQDKATIESMAKSPLQVAGSALQVGSMFAPVGTTAKVISKGAEVLGAGAKLAKVAGNVGAGVATGYGFDVGANLQEGKTGKEALKPGGATAIGAAIPLAGPVIKGAARIGAEGLGVTTGTGYGSIKQLFNASAKGGAEAQAARDALRGNTTPEQIVQEAKGALDQIKTARAKAYQTSLARLKETKETYDITPVIESVESNLKKFGVHLDQQGELDFSRSPIRFNTAAQDDITKIVETMKDFGSKKGDRTVIGLDSLKRAFGDLYSPSGEARGFVQDVKSSVRKILSEVPGYDDMSANYEDKTHLINDIQKALSLGDKASIDTAFRKLTTVLRTNNEERKILVDELDAISGGKLVPMIAGQQMSEVLPRGIARQIEGFGAIASIMAGLGGPLVKMALFASPRVVGEMVNALGVGARASKFILESLGGKTAQFPGDAFVQSKTGKAVANYVKEVQPGLSMKKVGFTKDNSHSRLISEKELQYLKDEGHLPPNVDGMVNIIKPGQESKIKGVGGDKVYRVVFNDKIRPQLESAQIKDVFKHDPHQDAFPGYLPSEMIASVNTLDGKAVNIKTGKIQPTPIRNAEGTRLAGSKAAIPKELEPLAAEARKYKSAEEFVKAKSGNQGLYEKGYESFINENRASAKPYDYELMDRVFGTKPETSGDLVKVYRFTDNGVVLPGDNVSVHDLSKIKHKETMSKMGTESFAGNRKYKMIEQWIPKDSLYQTSAGTQIYAPNGIKSLTDFYNKFKAK